MKNNIIALVLFALVAGLAYKVTTYYEYVEEETDLGWSREAKRNPFLAAQLYLQNEGLQVESLNRYPNLAASSPEDTLLLGGSRQVYSDRLIDALTEWVSNGGHLIVGASQSSIDSRDPLLEYFDLSLTKTECDCGIVDFSNVFKQDKTPSEKDTGENGTSSPDGTDDVEQEENEPTLSKQLKHFNDMVENGSVNSDGPITDKNNEIIDPRTPDDQITTLSFNAVEKKFNVDFNSNFSLDHPYFYWEDSDTNEDGSNQVEFVGLKPTYWTGDDHGVHFVQFSLGNGLVSVMSNSRPLLSQNIGYFDHADLLSTVVGSTNQVKILYGVVMPSLWSLITQYAPELLFSFGLWLLFWVTYRWQRFGPIKEDANTIRRSLREHIFASARFIWHSDDKNELVLPLQNSVHHNAAIQLPGYDGMNNQERFLLLSDLTGLTVETIGFSLSEATSERKDQFLKKIKTLQIIETKLKNTA